MSRKWVLLQDEEEEPVRVEAGQRPAVVREKEVDAEGLALAQAAQRLAAVQEGTLRPPAGERAHQPPRLPCLEYA